MKYGYLWFGALVVALGMGVWVGVSGVKESGVRSVTVVEVKREVEGKMGEKGNEVDKDDKGNMGNREDKGYMGAMMDEIERVVLPVPFQSQAPFGDWREPWQEACEEASLVLASRFVRGIGTLTKDEMRDEILKLVEFQNARYGDYKDSDADRTAQIGGEVYGLEIEVRELTAGASRQGEIGGRGEIRGMREMEGISEIRKMLRQGKVVIAPLAGRLLKNPYFRQPGPLYHMLIIRGFDEATGEFITNDVGTRRGEGFRYSYSTLWNALHDFPGEKEKILQGVKRVLVVSGCKF